MSGQNNAAITVQRLADGDWRLTKCAGVATISLEESDQNRNIGRERKDAQKLRKDEEHECVADR
jgi:hypothetical protein